MAKIHLSEDHLQTLMDIYVQFEAEMTYSDEAATDLYNMLAKADRQSWSVADSAPPVMGYSPDDDTDDERLDLLNHLFKRWSGVTLREFLIHLGQGLKKVGVELLYDTGVLDELEQKVAQNLAQLEAEPEYLEDEITIDLEYVEPSGMRPPEQPLLRSDDLKRMIGHDAILGPIAAKVEPLIEKSLGLMPAEGKSHLGGARIFGCPDLPAGVSWPTKRAGRLPFLMQLPLPRIHDLCPEAPLPDKGMLFVFADDRSMHIIHSTAMLRAAKPQDDEYSVPIKLVPRTSLPSPWVGGIEELRLTSKERAAYEKLWRRVERTGRCYLLGHPTPHQENLLLHSPELTFLLQVDLEEVYDEAGGGNHCLYAAAPSHGTRQGSFNELLFWTDR